MKRIGVVVLLFLFVSLPAVARADNLFFTPLGVELETYGGPTHPVPIGTDGFRMTFNGGGPKTVIDPIILVLGIPEGGTAPTIEAGDNDGFTSVLVDPGYTTSPYYGGSWNTTTGRVPGHFDSPGNVYEFIGFTPTGVDSQNYTNWTLYSDVSSWDIYVYAVIFNPDFNATTHDWVDFEVVGGSLQEGTYVAAYGCLQVLNGYCSREGTTQSTPFTRAGLVTQVPEPASASLLLLSLAGLFVAVGKRHDVA